MKTFEHLLASAVSVQFHIVADSAGGKQAIHSPRRDQFLRNDDIEKRVRFGEYLTRLRTLFLVLKNSRVSTFQAPGVEEGRPVNKLAQRCQREIIQDANSRE